MSSSASRSVPILAVVVACGVDLRPEAASWEPPEAPTTRGVSGTVAWADGRPAAGAWVTASPGGHEVQADPDGRFVLRHVSAGAETLLAASGGAVGEAALAQDVDVAVVLGEPPPSGARVAVQAAGPDGAALAGLVVSAGGADLGVTDADGALVAWASAEGDLTLELTDPSGRVAGASLPVEGLTEAAGVQWSPVLSWAAADARALGSAACGACHAEAWSAWVATPHARALLDAAPEGVEENVGGGITVELGGATLRLSPSGAGLQAELADGPSTWRWPVAGWIGAGARASVPWVEGPDGALPLPVAWVTGDPSRPGYPDAAASLVPWSAARWVEGGAASLPSPDQTAEAACFGCHATGFSVARRDDGGAEMAALVGVGRFQEAAVGCEACHGPGGDHRRDAGGSPGAHIVHPGRLDPVRADDTCGACHASTAAHGSGLPYAGRGEGGFSPGERLADHADATDDLWASGAAAAPGQQHTEHAASAHGAAALTCSACHAPHGDGDAGGLWASADDNALCASCHLGLDFEGDDDVLEEHLAHARIDPGGLTEGGRCTGCHMPKTATDAGWGAASGAGTLGSHTFVASDPAQTVDAFGSATTLPLGAFPAHACGDCHAWNAWRFGLSGVPFPGADGDPTQRATHAEHAAEFAEVYP